MALERIGHLAKSSGRVKYLAFFKNKIWCCKHECRSIVDTAVSQLIAYLGLNTAHLLLMVSLQVSSSPGFDLNKMCGFPINTWKPSDAHMRTIIDLDNVL